MGRFLPRWIPVCGATLIPGAALAFLTSPKASYAETWNIKVDGSGDATTIQGGITSAAVGDTVLVWPGTYYENIDYLGKDVILLAKYGPAATTIDGSTVPNAVVKLANGESRAAVLKGFSITGGTGTSVFGSPRGGGIVCVGSSPTIADNVIIDNHVAAIGQTIGVGGGIAIGDGRLHHPIPNPLITGNILEGNSAQGDGGGMSVQNSDVTIINNTFQGNTAMFDGGGLWAPLYEGTLDLDTNRFIQNVAGDHGGGVYAVRTGAAADFSITRNLIARNVANGSEPGDDGSGGGMATYDISGTVSQNTIAENQGYGESVCGGGGILLDGVGSGDLTISDNIIAFNLGCGIACRTSNGILFGTNLLWANDSVDFFGCPSSWASQAIMENPYFCDATHGDYTVASDSPALAGGRTIGAYLQPGCGPVAVLATTWGTLKSMFK